MLRLPRFAAVLSAACLLLASCSKDDTPPAPHVRPEVADRTVMMFLGGNNNLLSNFMANVKDASRFVSAHTLNDCRLLAFIQPRTNLAAVLELSYDYERGGCVIDTLRKWQDAAFCSADGERIREVLGYMAQEAPAKAYGLIMGSHGTGWVPSQYMTLSSLRSPDADFWKKADGAYETRWFGSDKERSTDITTLSSCLTALRSEGVKFDYLIFDACFMGNIETFYELRGCADYLLGSPCEIMSHGFPYEQAMPYLFADEGRSFDLAGVCRSYVAFYDTEYSVRSGLHHDGRLVGTRRAGRDDEAGKRRSRQVLQPELAAAVRRAELASVHRPGGLRRGHVRRSRPARGFLPADGAHVPDPLPHPAVLLGL